MESQDLESLAPELVRHLAGFGIECDAARASLLLRHLSLVIEKNKVVNLTRITSPEEALVLHVVDSLLPLACPEVKLSSASHIVDLGTGAGYPGIPLAIMTGASALLVDSVGKKVSAVNEFVESLGLGNVYALHARVEELPAEHLGRQDFVFARAVAQSNVLIEYAAPLLRMHGRLVLEKGRPSEEEFDASLRSAKICGMTHVSRETFELPEGLGHREILIYEKVSKPKVKLPRRTGLAKKEPLGV